MRRSSRSEEVTVVTAQHRVPARSATPPCEPVIIVLTGEHVGQVFDLNGDQFTLGREDQAQLKILDEGISRTHCRIVRLADGHFALEDCGSRNGTYVNGQRVTAPHRLTSGDHIEIGTATVLKYAEQDPVEAQFATQMYQAALRDGLTGAYNRRYFDDRLIAEFNFARRHGAPLGLLLIDIDHFKAINDQHGHPAGDSILQQFSRLVMKTIRSEDIFARYGGEEFAIVCRNTNLIRASILAERIRHAAADYIYQLPETSLNVTVSIGVVAYPMPEKSRVGSASRPAIDLAEPAADEITIDNAQKLLELADTALYRAKEGGRNCTATLRTHADE